MSDLPGCTNSELLLLPHTPHVHEIIGMRAADLLWLIHIVELDA
jgi:hypothetical protein